MQAVARLEICTMRINIELCTTAHYFQHHRQILLLGLHSAGLTIVANVAIATGPALLGAQRSSVINLIYYIV